MSFVARFAGWSFWSKPSMLWLVHAVPTVYLLGAVVGPLGVYIGGLFKIGSVLLAIAIVMSLVPQFAHEVQLCARCAANMPLNDTRAAKVVRVLLWLHHRQGPVSLAILPLGAWNMFGSMSLALEIASSIVITLAVGALVQAMLVHRAHRPWCPYCNGGWEDDPGAPVEPVLDPTPPSKTTPVQ